VRVREIVQVGEEPLRASTGRPPAPGFRLAQRIGLHGLVALRFLAARPYVISERKLSRGITLQHGIVLAPGSARTAR
jgi:hypothetical protein